jgi:hypothetical protein
MVAVCYPEKSVDFQRNTLRHIPEDKALPFTKLAMNIVQYLIIASLKSWEYSRKRIFFLQFDLHPKYLNVT